ncbi:MAG: helix-turn-helix transcriptional regulator [Bacteroidetes bacterium]|nr:helix-turn-helix transcriptional regulator [Bacteroidota bacterium]MBS1942712.1 helix-turn-helix transcriptional regulator [Bacteroidota bacterium]
MNYERIGRKIERVRNLRNYTQTYMAQQLGIQQNTYSLWEKGKGLTEERVEAIAKILDVPVEELNNPAPFTLVMNHNHGNNGHVNVEHQQQHLMDERLVKLLTEHMAQVIRDQAELLKETQADRVRMLELLAHWSKGTNKKPKD